MKAIKLVLGVLLVVGLLVVPLGGVLSPTTVSAVPTGPIGYAVGSDGDGHLYSIDLSTGNTTDLGLVGLWDAQGLASIGSTLYGIGGTVNEFWDVTTPPGFKVGNTGPRNGIDAGLAYDRTSGKMYNIQRIPSQTWLYEINTANGSATLIGSSTVAAPDGLAFDNSGVAYALDGLNKDSLYTVDLSSGNLTLVGSLGVNLWNEVGLAFDSASGTLYGLTDGGTIYTINSSNGTATFVANTLSGFEDLTIPNQPPDTSGAYANPGCLWPPNHKFVSISILGVTDPDGDPVTINITSITSDEPTASDKGSGGAKHAPDADGIGTNTASVRAERSGDGDGRVYMIYFTASDGQGGESEGRVTVNVPHDQSDATCPAIHSGTEHDATKIN